MRRLKVILLFIATIACCVATYAQRRITPINNATTATQAVNENRLPADSIDRSKMVQYRDEKGHIVLVDTVTGIEIVDTVVVTQKVPPMKYPLVFDASIGLDLWNPLMKAFGQSYGLAGVSAHFNMHNRYIASFEFGFGQANNTPADNNYTYHTDLSPYFKIGMDYNFLYNSNPDYQLFAGLRYGFSPFRWTLRDVSVDGSYWGEPEKMNFPELSATAGYLEFLLGIKVKIYRNISMGWTFRYHRVLHESPTLNGKAWYIPGMGTSNSAIGASLSVYYTLPLGKSKSETPPQAPLPPGSDITGESTTETQSPPHSSQDDSDEL